MKKVAVFGNTGAGKSTTSRTLAEITGLPLYALDMFKFASGGREIPHTEYLDSHSQILCNSEWIIDGFGCLETTWKRLSEADTLVYIDLPITVHFFWVTKRFLKGLFTPPDGWPKNSPLLKSTLKSYHVLWLCHRKLTPAYRRFVAKTGQSQKIYHLRSKAEIENFLNSIQNQY
ncbi:MAG: adenylate kinase [Halopseudomonas aestusnigri]